PGTGHAQRLFHRGSRCGFARYGRARHGFRGGVFRRSSGRRRRKASDRRRCGRIHRGEEAEVTHAPITFAGSHGRKPWLLAFSLKAPISTNSLRNPPGVPQTMKNIRRHFSILLVAMFVVTGNVFAADEKPPRPGRGSFAPRRPEARLKTMTEKLSLNEEQQGKVKAILEKNIAKVVELAEDKSLSNEDRRVKITDVRKAEMQEINGLLTP